MLAHISVYLIATTIGLGTLKFCLVEANHTRRIIKQNFLNEIFAHQCGRALALIKNMESAARRIQKSSLKTKNDSHRAIGSVASATARQVTTIVASHYQPLYGFQGTDCIKSSSKQVIATSYLLNADEDNPETGYFTYRVQLPREQRTHRWMP